MLLREEGLKVHRSDMISSCLKETVDETIQSDSSRSEHLNNGSSVSYFVLCFSWYVTFVVCVCVNLQSVFVFCLGKTSLKTYKCIFSLPAAVFGNVIKPNKTDVFAQEGSSVTLSCSFSTSGGSDDLHWYRQYGRSKPEFLVLTFGNAKEAQVSDVDPRFTVEVEKKEQIHVYLEISSATVSDSAVYYCALRPTVTGNTSAQYKNLLQ